MTSVTEKYFPHISAGQKSALEALEEIYARWNSQINVISRKDFINFQTHHLLHSLAIAKVFSFSPGEKVIDIGTGGGFPGIPLAILFPETEFFLIDSIAKKIKVVNEVKHELNLHNVVAVNSRAENYHELCNCIVTRAVAPLSGIEEWMGKNIIPGGERAGIIALKGGDLEEELLNLKERTTIWNISDFFDETFFETKKILFLKSKKYRRKENTTGKQKRKRGVKPMPVAKRDTIRRHKK